MLRWVGLCFRFCLLVVCGVVARGLLVAALLVGVVGVVLLGSLRDFYCVF